MAMTVTSLPIIDECAYVGVPVFAAGVLNNYIRLEIDFAAPHSTIALSIRHKHGSGAALCHRAAIGCMFFMENATCKNLWKKWSSSFQF